MVNGVVVACIVMLGILAGLELLYLLMGSHQNPVQHERQMFTVLLYRQEDTEFAADLRWMITHAHWMGADVPATLYVVYEEIPEAAEREVRGICAAHENLIYCSWEEFIAILRP
jgi:hypothetical protein